MDELEESGDPSNRDIVEMIVGYLTIVKGQEFSSSNDVRASFADLHLSTPSRVANYLSEGTKKPDQRFVKKGKGYALHRNSQKKFRETTARLLGKKSPEIAFEVLIGGKYSGGRSYLGTLISQINGTYTYGFYDATAVLMRRLMESLLIESFVACGHAAKIQDTSNNFLPLNALINQAKNPANIHFSRGLDKTMAHIKDIGDAAAHNRTYITTKLDIDNVQSKFRRLIDELCKKAGIS